jgi:hypothetical protein
MIGSSKRFFFEKKNQKTFINQRKMGLTKETRPASPVAAMRRA